MMTEAKQLAELQQLWGEGALRVFISHTAAHKQVAKDIQGCLNNLGIASFVAHEDIEPMKEWEGEIEKALESMDLLLALLTDDFGQSEWTDQEVGVAVGRKVHVIPVHMGKDPYGFVGRYQAIPGGLESTGIANALLAYARDEDSLKDSTVSKAVDAQVEKFKQSEPLIARHLKALRPIRRLPATLPVLNVDVQLEFRADREELVAQLDALKIPYPPDDAGRQVWFNYLVRLESARQFGDLQEARSLYQSDSDSVPHSV